MKAKEIMIKEVISIKEDDDIKDVATILLENKIGGLPVVNKENKIVGVISETDMIKKEKKHINMPPFISILQGVIFLDSFKTYEENVKKICAQKVKELMSKDVIKVKEDDEVNDVVSIMIEKSINRVPVVDDNDVLKGIICRYDIIKAMYKK